MAKPRSKPITTGSVGKGEAGMRAALLIIRLFLGGYFLFTLLTLFIDRAAFMKDVQLGTGENGIYVAGNLQTVADWLQQIVHPHYMLFAWLVLCGLAVVGLLLLLGLFTRVAACLGIVMNISFLLVTLHIQQGNTGAFSLGFNSAFLIMEVAVLITSPGRFFGLDALWRRKK